MQLLQVPTQLDQLKQFRQELYQLFPYRADALMDLLDALCSNTQARSVVELSLNPLFRREYGSLHDALDQLFHASSPEEAGMARRRTFGELSRAVGTTTGPSDRRLSAGVPTTPVLVVGHGCRGDRPAVGGDSGGPGFRVSAPPGERPGSDHHWAPILGGGVLAGGVRRAQPSRGIRRPSPGGWCPCRCGGCPPTRRPRRWRPGNGSAELAERLQELLTDGQQPFHGELVVLVADSGYSGVEFLGAVADQPNMVSVVRVATNRVFYRPAPPVAGPRKGHPRWYGERFELGDPSSWGVPDETAETTWQTGRGRTYRVRLQAWRPLLLRGSRAYAMHRHPVTLIRAEVFDEQGKAVYRRPLWLLVSGARQRELSLVEAWEAYGQRFDLEHFFRFGRQRLLLAGYQTPVGEHEENWVTLVQLAAVQLWLVRGIAGASWRPWERSRSAGSTQVASPSQVQRNWAGIIRPIGTPARPPKRRGKSPGRAKGASPGRRPRHRVMKKARRGRATWAA